MTAVSVETEPTFSPGNPEPLFEAPYLAGEFGRTRPFDIAPDGRFLMIKEGAAVQEPGGARHIVVVQNWLQELTELVPVP